MFWASYLLAVLAIILAWPVPILLSRAQWPARSPFTAMVLWQAIALAGGLSMIGAMLVYGLEPIGDNLIAGLRSLAGMVLFNAPTTALGFWHIFALSAAALLTAHLVFTLLLTYYRIQRQRRRHRELLALLASPSSQDTGTLVISHDSPVAYCLPGGARSVTVLSDGLMAALEPAELQAVLTHENAHLSQRHHLLLWAFAAWRQALPWLPTTRLAQESVSSLIEMLADDVALRTASKATLIKAIAIVASGSPAGPNGHGASQAAPGMALSGLDAAAGTAGSDSARTTASRVSRLLSPQTELPRAARSLVLTACVLLLAIPTALLVVPGLLG
ncbi:peptidase M48 Ste24p [Pseudarthrobacter chlorophenolicus A6]|uniref:Peptidase M48 Ste24p n=1 Tax=Pseudarthrobacter chlorophenolicus (strain ATCC 700700 / DSM 12829 / CIP 107037 / JCM 12360 / KCTC 9906 / NCIMB 13794 / A6) TaxID=452863 RepID=B8HH13_PSECP|nr:M56 family metallopeptidase [Pseudarthrobacter chlorophenolicus]ACL39602.1 peptidase M48 Ste24p [Pseudarthrobacter chlorophenolicus A6]SDQ96710.1 Peptidase family M48 [Pseudarthrobacter chlorophenolicus]